MKIFFIGDVVGQAACESLKAFLPAFKRNSEINIVIANGENSADGNGITPFSANLLFDAGVDVITTGNHCFKRQSMDNFYNENSFVIRPANFGKDAPGKGFCLLDYGSFSVAVINLAGITYMQPADNPFKCIDDILEEIDTKNIIVDFHAEATAEKKAMGYFLSKKVSAVIGTHTHVQTADEIILSEHTAYITDAGMTGTQNSVLGIEKNVILEKFLYYYPKKHVLAIGECFINGVIVDIDNKSGRALSISRINKLLN